MKACILSAPRGVPFTVSTWDGETSVHEPIEGLSVDAAREVASANSALGHTCTVDAEGADYREVWQGGVPKRAGRFAEVTLVRREVSP